MQISATGILLGNFLVVLHLLLHSSSFYFSAFGLQLLLLPRDRLLMRYSSPDRGRQEGTKMRQRNLIKL